ncbi:MAG TPA: hypothetical protein VFO16_08675 [Pseudonocardiaceae bacterium]|nr:hypothetical protein [Pseudonocardiaceae bacterium]
MATGLFLMAGVLIAMGWFAIGWVARGQENRKYAESRLRYLADQAIEEQREFIEARARWEAERVPQDSPTVVNVFIAAPPIPSPRSAVIDGEVIRALPAVRAPREE